IVSILLLISAVISTFSRGGFLTLAVIMISVLVKRMRRRGAGLLVGALVLLVFASFFLMPGYGQRMSTIVDTGADSTGSATARWNGMVLAWYVMLEHPILGVGLKQHGLRFMDWVGDWSWVGVHNVFLEIGADLGVPALLLYLGALWQAFRGVRRSLQR